jgi:hypothetical protein
MNLSIQSLSLDDLDYECSYTEHLAQQKTVTLSRLASSLCLESVSTEGIGPKSSFVLLRPGMFLALYDKKQAELIGQHELNRKRLVLVKGARYEKTYDCNDQIGGAKRSTPACLEEIFMFDKKSNALRRQTAGDVIIFYTGTHARHQSKTIFLLGCHLMMSYNYSAAHVEHILQRLGHSLKSEGCEFLMTDYWGAMEVARGHGWVDFRESFDSPFNECNFSMMDEYLHYAR